MVVLDVADVEIAMADRILLLGCKEESSSKLLSS
jgi:hypothetical protein